MIKFIDSGYNASHYNMALDEYLLRNSEGFNLCVYGWSVPAISIGYGQNAANEVNISKLQSEGFHLVRRLTGGRAVLHDVEITYSVTGDIGGVFGETLNDTYYAIARGLKETLTDLGVDSEISKGSARDVREKSGASLPCFASTSRHELLVNNRKIVGSAQRREKSRFLQHGSLILQNRLDITEYLNIEGDKRDEYKAILERESVTLKEAACGKDYTYSELSAAFRTGFSRAFEMETLNIEGCNLDCSALRELERRYFSEEWNNPK
ncbi:MAG: lipoate--protein ligase family protein [Fibrobacteres bacterium]|nr:lipoate--protein ligase family protein [Fibrobacterota bacterium]